MSEEQLKAFLQAVKADAILQEKLKSAPDTQTVVTIAKEAGFNISADEFNKTQNQVSENELEGLAGGAFPTAGKLFGGDCKPNVSHEGVGCH